MQVVTTSNHWHFYVQEDWICSVVRTYTRTNLHYVHGGGGRNDARNFFLTQSWTPSIAIDVELSEPRPNFYVVVVNCMH